VADTALGIAGERYHDHRLLVWYSDVAVDAASGDADATERLDQALRLLDGNTLNGLTSTGAAINAATQREILRRNTQSDAGGHGEESGRG
jgi:hypothetical protein